MYLAKSSTGSYYLKDLRGSVVKVTDASGTVKNTYAYEPYGAHLTANETVDNPYRYVGGYYDSFPALYKFGARYYNPNDGRWTQLDPSGQEYGYTYANANPVNFTDPDGEAPIPLLAAGAAAVRAAWAVAKNVRGNVRIDPPVGHRFRASDGELYYRWHLQVNLWIKGSKGSDVHFRVPIPFTPKYPQPPGS